MCEQTEACKRTGEFWVQISPEDRAINTAIPENIMACAIHLAGATRHLHELMVKRTAELLPVARYHAQRHARVTVKRRVPVPGTQRMQHHFI